MAIGSSILSTAMKKNAHLTTGFLHYGAIIFVVFLLLSCTNTRHTTTAPHSQDPYYTPNYPAPKPGTNPSDRYAIKHDRGSSVPINIDDIPDAVPVAEPYSAGGNKSPYIVLG